MRRCSGKKKGGEAGAKGLRTCREAGALALWPASTWSFRRLWAASDGEPVIGRDAVVIAQNSAVEH